jgi:hypothetical protein
MKNQILLENYYLPGQLEQSIGEFVEYYNNCRYWRQCAAPRHVSADLPRIDGRALLRSTHTRALGRRDPSR